MAYACVINNLWGDSRSRASYNLGGFRWSRIHVSPPMYATTNAVRVAAVLNSASSSSGIGVIWENHTNAQSRLVSFIPEADRPHISSSPGAFLGYFWMRWKATVIPTFRDANTVFPGNLQSITSPLTDFHYEVRGLDIEYYVPLGIGSGGRRKTVDINFTNPVRFRRISEFNTGISAIGFSDFRINPLNVMETAMPEIVCIDLDDDTRTTVTVTTLPTPTPGAITVTVIDGDPPERTNSNAAHYVQTTTPTDTEVGDLWFNPSNNQLRIYTEDD